MSPSSVSGARGAPVRRLAWRTNALLFVATGVSVFVTRFNSHDPVRLALRDAGAFTGTLLAILLAHEFGHYIAARIHKVDASLPFFIPLPILSPFGTMGAVIRMKSVIPTRRALLDIGAAGPLAGLVLAIPAYAWGIAHSQLQPVSALGDDMQLGNSLLSMVFDRWFGPAIPAAMDVELSPVGLAGWVGMFVTMINLIPVGQLDGGHVAFALFGPRQNRIAQWVHRSMLVFFFVSVGSFVARDVRAGMGLWHVGRHVNNSLFWLVWFELLAALGGLAQAAGAGDWRRRGSRGSDGSDAPNPLTLRTRGFATLGLALLAGIFHDSASPALWVTWFSGLGLLIAMEVRWGALHEMSHATDHPATGEDRLSLGRTLVAILTLAFFALLFMPTPIGL